jgi:phage baseplate assembly protein W
MATVADNRFSGLPYPIMQDPRGVFHPQSGSIQIRSSLLAILLTNRFERVMENDFGAGLDDQLFELAGPGIEQVARDRILQQIAEYEPRVTVEDLVVTTTPPPDALLADNDPGDQILYIRIKYVDPQNITQVQDLTLELPIGGNSLTGEL